MNCTRFRSQLRSLVESRSSLSATDDGMREHLANCRDLECRQAWLEACLLDQAIGDWAADFPQPELCDRVVEELQSSRRESARGAAVAAKTAPGPVRASRVRTAPAGNRNPSYAVVVSVALLVLLSLIAILSAPRPRPLPDEGNGHRPIADRGDDPGTAVPAVPDGELSPSAVPDPLREEAELSGTYLSMAEDATQFLTDTVALTLGGEEEIEDPTAAADWIHRIEERIGPWGDDFDAALDRFLNTLPDSET